jgi:hypothetical protein
MSTNFLLLTTTICLNVRDDKCHSAEPAYLWPEVAAPEPWELQSIVEELYHSDVFAKMSCHATSRKTRQNKRGFISRRAGTAGTGGTKDYL